MPSAEIDPLDRLKELFNSLAKLFLKSYQVVVVVIAVVFFTVIGLLLLLFKPL